MLEIKLITFLLQTAEGISAFGNVQSGSEVEEEMQICERPAETAPASRSVGCLNFYVPLLTC